MGGFATSRRAIWQEQGMAQSLEAGAECSSAAAAQCRLHCEFVACGSDITTGFAILQDHPWQAALAVRHIYLILLEDGVCFVQC